jgi:hypothetical protein
MDRLQIKEILMKDKNYMEHFVKEHPSKYGEVKWKISKEMLTLDGYSSRAIGQMRKYLRLPMIEDNFPLCVPNEDNIRNEWQKEIVRKYEGLFGDEVGKAVMRYLTDNKLAANFAGKKVLSSLMILETQLSKDWSGITALIQDTESLIINGLGKSYSRYKQYTLGERINFNRSVEDYVFDILWEIHED